MAYSATPSSAPAAEKLGKSTDWIKVYPDVFTPKECNMFIQLFELMSRAGNVDVTKETYRRCQVFTQLDSNAVLFEKVKAPIREALKRYKQDVGNGTLNFVSMLESPNIIRYLPKDPEGENYFHPHADSWSMDSTSRQLSIIVYLNDVAEGGETTFTDYDLSVAPKKGSVLIFPSNFCFIHTGEAPVSGLKYIIVSWLHFGGTGHGYRCHAL
jgi:hypothetical protein